MESHIFSSYLSYIQKYYIDAIMMSSFNNINNYLCFIYLIKFNLEINFNVIHSNSLSLLEMLLVAVTFKKVFLSADVKNPLYS